MFLLFIWVNGCLWNKPCFISGFGQNYFAIIIFNIYKYKAIRNRYYNWKFRFFLFICDKRFLFFYTIWITICSQYKRAIPYTRNRPFSYLIYSIVLLDTESSDTVFSNISYLAIGAIHISSTKPLLYFSLLLYNCSFLISYPNLLWIYIFIHL